LPLTIFVRRSLSRVFVESKVDMGTERGRARRERARLSHGLPPEHHHRRDLERRIESLVGDIGVSGDMNRCSGSA
jgi:hypothetical protein